MKIRGHEGVWHGNLGLKVLKKIPGPGNNRLNFLIQTSVSVTACFCLFLPKNRRLNGLSTDVCFLFKNYFLPNFQTSVLDPPDV